MRVKIKTRKKIIFLSNKTYINTNPSNYVRFFSQSNMSQFVQVENQNLLWRMAHKIPEFANMHRDHKDILFKQTIESIYDTLLMDNLTPEQLQTHNREALSRLVSRFRGGSAPVTSSAPIAPVPESSQMAQPSQSMQHAITTSTPPNPNIISSPPQPQAPQAPQNLAPPQQFPPMPQTQTYDPMQQTGPPIPLQQAQQTQQPPQHTSSVTSNQSIFVESKQESFQREFLAKQQEYDMMSSKPNLPDPSEVFQNQPEEEKITNMNELLEQYERQRNKDIEELQPPNPDGEGETGGTGGTGGGSGIGNTVGSDEFAAIQNKLTYLLEKIQAFDERMDVLDRDLRALKSNLKVEPQVRIVPETKTRPLVITSAKAEPASATSLITTLITPPQTISTDL